MLKYKDQVPELIYHFLGYLQVERGYSKQTIYNYFVDLRIFSYFMLEKHQGKSAIEEQNLSTIDLQFFKQITRQDITSYLAWLSFERNLRENSRNRKIASLKSFYKYLVDMDLLDKSIMVQVAALKTKKSLPKYLERDKVGELMVQITDQFWVRDTAIILLMMSAGLRVSEVVSLNLLDVKVDSLIVTGKGQKERQVYLSQHTSDALQDYLILRGNEGSPLFLSNQKKRISVRTIQYMTKKYLTRIDKQDYSCHKLRHTAATQLLKNGANIREIQVILGHESISTTEIYTHVGNDDLKRVAKILDY